MCITPKLHIKKSHVASQHHCSSSTALSIIQTVATSEICKKYFLMKLTMNAYAVFLSKGNNVFKIFYYYKSLQRISQS